jgi:branched-chain amino acid transport system permease protein
MPELVMQSIASGVAIGCVYGLIGIGFCVIYNASGIVNFAQGAFVMLGGMVASVAFQTYGVPLPLAAILAIVICVIIGIVLERIVVRPLWDRQSPTFVLILSTLAAQIVIERLTLLVAGDQPHSLPMFTDREPLRVTSLAISYQFFWIVGGSALVIALLALFFSSTKTGKAMRVAPSIVTPPRCKASQSL